MLREGSGAICGAKRALRRTNDVCSSIPTAKPRVVRGRNRTPKGGTILQLRRARPGLRVAVADAIQGTLPLFTPIVGCEPILFTLTGDPVRLAEWVTEKQFAKFRRAP